MGRKGEGWEVTVNTEVGVQLVPLETIKSQGKGHSSRAGKGSRRKQEVAHTCWVRTYIQKYSPRTRSLHSLTDEDTNIQMVRSISKIT